MSDDLSLDARLLRFRSDPGAEACHELSAALLDAQRAREALEVLSRGLSLREDDVRLLRLAARAFLAEGDVLRAQQTLTRVIRMHPNDVDAYRLLAETLLQRGDVGRAAAAVAKAISLSPGDAALIALRARLSGGGAPEAALQAASEPAPVLETRTEPQAVPEPPPAPQTASATAVDAPPPEVEPETERDALVRDVQVMLGEAMKATSSPPPAMATSDSEARPSRRPLPSPGLLAAKLPPRSVPPAAASPNPLAHPVTAAPGPETPEAPDAAEPVGPASVALPPAPAVPAPAAPAARPGPRRSPTLMGFAPPRPPARPASVPPPARTAPLPAIRPPSVRPPSLTGPVAPPNFGPPVTAIPLPAPMPLPALAPAPLAVEREQQVEQDEDEPTSFMDRESLAGALGVSLPLASRESKRPAAAVLPVSAAATSASPARPAPASPLPDTLPEFVVPELGDAPVESSKRSAALMPQRLDAEPSVKTVNDSPRSRATEPAGRKRGSGARAGGVLLLAVLVVLGGGVAAHRAGLLPEAVSQRIDALVGQSVNAPAQVEPTLEAPSDVVEPAPAPAPAPEVDQAAARSAELDAALAQGRVPAQLPEGDEPEALRMRAEAALLYATPWWSTAAADTDRTTLDALAAQLTRATDGASPADATMLRATVVRLRAASNATAALADARALAAEFPDDALVRWALAEVLLATGERAEADTLLAQLVESGPERMRARAAMQRLWVARLRDDHATASAALDVARALAPDWELVRLRSLDLRLDAGDYRAVLAELSPADGEAAPADEDSELMLRQLRAHVALEQLDASEALWERLPSMVQQRADVQPIAAEYYIARGEPVEAVRALEDLARAEPGDPTLIALYANALYESGQTLVASAQFERAIALDQGHPEALIGFAQVLLRARKYREARINLDRAEAGLRGRVRPPATLAHLRVMRARIMVEERELAQAATLLRRTLEIEGAPSEGWFYLGEALSRSHSTESRAAYERYLALHPAGPLATRARRAIQ